MTCSLASGCVIIGGGAYQTMDTVTTGATAVSYGTTGKGITDHAISKIVGKDCRMFNILQNKDFCYKGTSVENKNFLIGIYEENYQWEPVQSVKKSIKSPVVGDPVSKLTKGKQNESKLDTRHKRHAHKVWGKRSNLKIECKSSKRISRVQDKISTRRTG